MNTPALKVAFSVVALIAAAGLIYYTFTSGGDPNEGGNQQTFWLCKNTDCNAEFTLSLAEAARTDVVDGAIPCKQCSRVTAMRAAQCPACKRAVRLVGHAGLPTKCEHCGANAAQLARELRQGG